MIERVTVWRRDELQERVGDELEREKRGRAWEREREGVWRRDELQERVTR